MPELIGERDVDKLLDAIIMESFCTVLTVALFDLHCLDPVRLSSS
jgi:hypothetical protein